MTKICSRCGEEKTLKDFRKRAKSPDGHSVWCKLCFSNYDRERYKAGDKTRKDRNREKRKNRNRQFIWFYLKEHPCPCGESDPLVLDFDHLDRSQKHKNVTEMFDYSLETLKDEIAKCRVLCANCHRRHTVEQLGTWRGVFNMFIPDEYSIEVFAKYNGFPEGSTLLDMFEWK